MSPYTSLLLSAVAALAMFSSQVKAQASDSAQAVEILLDQVPECYRQCEINLQTIRPPCSWSPPADSKESPEDVITNSISCLCTDKDYMSQAFSCLLDSCKSNATAISQQFDSQYETCAEVGGVKLAPPAELLKELSINVPSGVTVPSSASGQAKVTAFPSQTATVAYPSSVLASESSVQAALAASITAFFANPSAASGVTVSTVPLPSGAAGTGAAGTGAAGTGSGGQGTNGTAPAASTATPSGASSTTSGAKSSQTGSAVRNTAFGGMIGLVGVVGLMAAL